MTATQVKLPGKVNDEQHTDAAMGKGLRGGIDFNTTNALSATGDQANFQFDPAQLERFKSGDFTGLTPVITTITPVAGWAPILGFEAGKEQEASNV
jgi:hypothetical protein